MSTPRKDWRSKLPACFGAVDQIFASHPADRARAVDMMREAFNSGASVDDVLSAIREHLISKGAGEEHTEEQLQQARKLKLK